MANNSQFKKPAENNQPKKDTRVPPQNLDAERAVLGAIMLRQNALFDVGDILTPESFYAEKHRMIYQTMIDLSFKGDPIDLVSVSNKLKEKNSLDNIGGSAYVSDILGAAPASVNIKYYAEIVYKNYIIRKLIEVADKIAISAFNSGTEDVDRILDEAEKEIYSISENSNNKEKVVALKTTLYKTWEEIERLHATKDEIRGVPTGFHDLDNKLAGFQKSDLIILAARPSVGKTTLALDIARKAAVEHNVPVCFFSLEMSANQLASRMLSAHSRVNAWSIRTGKNLTENDFSLIRDSLDELSKAPIFIDDTPANTIMSMRSTARRLKSEGKLGLIVVDYLQLMNPSKNFDNMVMQVTEISRGLKGLAKELDVPVIALSQLSRAVEQRGGAPRLSDLRDSGSIEQDADVVMFIHREDKYKDENEKTNIAKIMIEKHRNGPTGVVDLYFDTDTSTFLSIDKTGGFDQMAPQGSSSSSNDLF